MIIYGIDFTSRPSRRKPITCLTCRLEGTRLRATRLEEWRTFGEFEQALQRPGPWCAGMDFPFGLPRRFIENIGWPDTWTGYVDHVGRMSREGFRRALDDYRGPRATGDKEHRRATDVAAGAISPQKLYGTPVGLMFYEGAPRLMRSGVSIPLLRAGDPQRVALETYPGVLARKLIGRRSYKQDATPKQSAQQRAAREELLGRIRHAGADVGGLEVDAPDDLAVDPGADHLDALLCSIQAAWAYTRRAHGYGIPDNADMLEGWIVGPGPVVR